MNDVATLIQWIRVFTFAAAICTTSVPAIYAFYPWRTRRFGQLFMLQAISFAIALDTSAVFSVWRPKHIVIIFFADLVFLALISASTFGLALQMWRVTHPSTKIGRHRSEDREQNV
jgi:hypothetical protein